MGLPGAPRHGRGRRLRRRPRPERGPARGDGRPAHPPPPGRPPRWVPERPHGARAPHHHRNGPAGLRLRARVAPPPGLLRGARPDARGAHRPRRRPGVVARPRSGRHRPLVADVPGRHHHRGAPGAGAPELPGGLHRTADHRGDLRCPARPATHPLRPRGRLPGARPRPGRRGRRRRLARRGAPHHQGPGSAAPGGRLHAVRLRLGTGPRAHVGGRPSGLRRLRLRRRRPRPHHRLRGLDGDRPRPRHHPRRREAAGPLPPGHVDPLRPPPGLTGRPPAGRGARSSGRVALRRRPRRGRDARLRPHHPHRHHPCCQDRHSGRPGPVPVERGGGCRRGPPSCRRALRHRPSGQGHC